MMNRAQALLFWLAVLLTAIPGFALLYMKYWLSPIDPYSVIHHPWQPYALYAHILMAPLLIFVFGILTVSHISPRYDSKISDGRKNGISLALLFWPMVASGYLLQGTISESFRRLMAWTHIAASVLFTLLLLVHFIQARKYRAKQVECSKSPY